jgi:CRISPR-associated protein Cas1
MGFRQIYIQEAKKISTSDNCLDVFRGEGKKPLSFPLEDLDLVFVEDPEAVVSSNLLTALSKYGIAMIFCGSDYLPATEVIPFNGHYLQSQMLSLQIDFLPSKKNKLWEFIIKQKITNQLKVLEETTNDEKTYLEMKGYLSNIKFGDEKNMEGLAARAYFRTLYGPDFIRFGNSPISSALNYGYSILTGAVIRSVAFSGLNDNLGIWHCNVKNANNLSCDLVEPFRQVVDYYVFNHLSELTIPLSKDIRHSLINLLNYYVLVNGKQYQVSYAISLLVEDYVEYLKNSDISLVGLPIFYVNEETRDGQGIL